MHVVFKVLAPAAPRLLVAETLPVSHTAVAEPVLCGSRDRHRSHDGHRALAVAVIK